MDLISRQDAGTLLNKLIEESTSVTAFLLSPDRMTCRLNGVIHGFSPNGRLGIVSSKLDSSASYIQALVNTDCKYSYGDKREIPDEDLPIAERYGNTALVVVFPEGSRLTIFFTL